MGREAGECAGRVEFALVPDGRGRPSLHYLLRDLLSASHFAIPNRAAILESLRRAPPGEHTVAPITVPAEMPAARVAPEDIPVRLLPRKSAAARRERVCGRWRHVPVFVNEFQPAPSAHSVRRPAMPPDRAACESPSG